MSDIKYDINNIVFISYVSNLEQEILCFHDLKMSPCRSTEGAGHDMLHCHVCANQQTDKANTGSRECLSILGEFHRHHKLLQAWMGRKVGLGGLGYFVKAFCNLIARFHLILQYTLDL